MKWQLTIELLSDWHIGSGQEAGAYADMVMLKSAAGLPYLPGRSLRGLLRAAVRQGGAHQWFGELPLERLLFGTEGQAGLQAQGLLQLTSGMLPEAAWLAEAPQLRQNLFHTYAATAIDSDTGTAREGSLRTIEVAVPVTLQAELALNTAHPDYSQLAVSEPQLTAYLAACCNLVTELGAQRHRGLGRCRLTLQTAGGETCAM